MINPNIEAEMAVLGCIFLNNETIPYIMSELSDDDFVYMPNKELYGACKELFIASKPIDFVTVANKFKNTAYLAEAANATPTTANLKHYIAVLKELSKRRKAQDKALEFLKSIETEDLTDCQDLAAKITDCFSDKNSIEFMSINDAIQNFYNTKGKKREYIKTGFATIDKYTYIDKGDFVIIGGKPSAGKTALTIQIGLNMSQERNVVYFSLETKPDKVFDRAFANLTDLNLKDIKAGGDSLGQKEWNKFSGNVGRISKFNFGVVKAGGLSVSQIKAQAIQRKAEIIFIDYLSLIKSTGKNLYERVTNISMDLHTLAQQLNLTVIALSQFNRNDNKVPDMSNLRESGQIEHDADLILLLYQPDPKSTDREIKIAKNKEGQTGNIRLRFDGIYQKFWEVIDR